MKKILKHNSLLLVFLLTLSCSKDDDGKKVPNILGSNVAELLVSNSPWTFSEYQLLEITDQGPSTISHEEIETYVNTEFHQLILNFNVDGSGTLNAPILNSAFTWQLQNNNTELFLIVEELSSPDDEALFTNLSISVSELQIDNEYTVYDENADYNVQVLGTLIFE